MEISTDPDGAVYVRWHDGGIWTVLHENGCMGRCGLGGQTGWSESQEVDERGDYDDGFQAGYDEAREDARAAVESVSTPGPAPKKKAMSR